jgi:hypothetical protein
MLVYSCMKNIARLVFSCAIPKDCSSCNLSFIHRSVTTFKGLAVRVSMREVKTFRSNR